MQFPMNCSFISILIICFIAQNSNGFSDDKETCYSKCAAIQCLAPVCRKNQTLITYRCTCCPVCVKFKQVETHQCTEECPEGFCELADIRCSPLDCVSGQIVLNKGGGPCGCCPICAYE